MLGAILGWIPLLGPIIQGIGGIYSKFKDTQLGMRNADVEEARISAQIIHDTNDDIALRILRDGLCTPAVGWFMLTGWDTIIAETTWKAYMWHVADFPPSVSYYPYAVLVFLLGNIGVNAWKRK